MVPPLRRSTRAGLTILAGLILAGAAAAQDRPIELKVKEAYLYNFIRFVEWPGDKPMETRPIRLKVAGPPHLAAAMVRTLGGRTVGSRAIEAVAISEPAEAAGADVLYVMDKDAPRAREFVQAVQGKPVLTVTETDNFPAAGSLVNFYIADQTVHFAVNANELERSPLHLSSQMLQFAAILRPEAGR
jgi:hypothetical protein